MLQFPLSEPLLRDKKYHAKEPIYQTGHTVIVIPYPVTTIVELTILFSWVKKSWETEEDNVFCIKKPFRWVPWIFTKERKKSFCCWAVLEEQIEGLELSSKAAAPVAVWQWRAAGGD